MKCEYQRGTRILSFFYILNLDYNYNYYVQILQRAVGINNCLKLQYDFDFGCLVGFLSTDYHFS
jgi:hypothetical protein